MLLRAILAAVLGTVVMPLSSTTEMQWVQRPASVVPGLATAKLLRPFGIRELKGRALDILATWAHWGYGTLWEQVELPVLGLAPWPWKWGLRYNAIDAWHHLAYAAGAVAGWALLGHLG